MGFCRVKRPFSHHLCHSSSFWNGVGCFQFKPFQTTTSTVSSQNSTPLSSFPSCGNSAPSKFFHSIVFDLSALRETLRQEFVEDQNKLILESYIRSYGIAMSHPESLPSLDSDNESLLPTLEKDLSVSTSQASSVVVYIRENMSHTVCWKCLSCEKLWYARITDRCNPQRSDSASCPFCISLGHQHGAKDKNISLVRSFPLLAAQWDEDRNQVPSNKVPYRSVMDVSSDSETKAWWRCIECDGPWFESVASRVNRYIERLKVEKNNSFATLCDDCWQNAKGRKTRSGELRKGDAISKSNHKFKDPNTSEANSSDGNAIRMLSEDPVLLKEVILKKSEDPGAIPLTSLKVLRWECTKCQFVFHMPLRDRAIRYKRCPQCTGKTPTPMNLLTIQRPDICQEIARTVSTKIIEQLTTHDYRQIQFVCHVCMESYQMPLRVRCLIPPERSACPKCLHAELCITSRMAFSSRPDGMSEGAAANLLKTQLAERRVPHRRELLTLTDHHLQQRDHMLNN